MDTDYEGKTSQMQSHAINKSTPNKKQKQDDHKTQYVAFEPQLETDGKQIAYIHSQPIRFLGKLIYKVLKDDDIRQMVNQKLLSMFNITEKSLLTGIMKMWIYNNTIILKMTWASTIYI